jgi:uncharacterized membrane protein YsdA (DUF1294 family)
MINPSNTLLFFYAFYLLVVNLTTAYLYYRDKRAAQQGKWRTPERTLFLANFLGGVFGAWLIFLGLRHKTRHLSFWLVQGMATIGHIGVLIWLLGGEF